MAEITGVSERTVRVLGLRDLVSAGTLVATRNPRAAIAARIVCDGSDVVTFWRRRPSMAVIAAAYGVLGVLALRARGGACRAGGPADNSRPAATDLG